MGAIAAFAKLQPSASPAWLAPVQKSGQAIWSASRWPDRKTEHWRYTSLRALEQGGYLQQGSDLALSNGREDLDESDLEALVRQYQIDGLEGQRLVFIDGRFSEQLSALDPASGVRVVPFSRADADQEAKLNSLLGSIVAVEGHLFAALNNQLVSEGAFIHAAAGEGGAAPVHVVHLSTAQPVKFNVQPRLLLAAETDSEVTLVEHFVSSDEPQNVFVNAVCELSLGRGARVNHYRLNQEHASILHIGGVHARLERDASLDSFYLANGGQLKRLDVVVDYHGEGASARMNGVYLPVGDQHVDFHTCVEHRVPGCTTAETFRGIVGDTASAVFNGRIHIHANAQKTQARLSNKNLLTSAKAQVYTKPELEIYADDVQCAHGATVAELDKTALHYLCTRGVSHREAKVMLSFGFINELINTVALQPLADYLRPRLARHFARDPELARHLL